MDEGACVMLKMLLLVSAVFAAVIFMGSGDVDYAYYRDIIIAFVLAIALGPWIARQLDS